MSTNDKSKGLDALEPTLSMRDLTAVLVKHYGLTEGQFELFLEFQIGTGPMGPDPANLMPGAMIGISKIGLRPALAQTMMTVDAAVANTAPAKAKPAKKPKPPAK